MSQGYVPAEDADAVQSALGGARDVPFWLDTPDRPAARAGPDRDRVVDLAIVGGGLTGAWAAILAAEADPDARSTLLEGRRLGWAASGRNGGFCSASLTHGLGNGVAHWPTEMPTLAALGRDNLDAIEVAAARLAEETGFDCGFQRTGELSVATQEWQMEGLAEEYEHAVDLGMDVELLDAAATRALVDSPTYTGGLLDRHGCALVDPARLVWGLAALAERTGTSVHEHSRVRRMVDEGDCVRLETETPDDRGSGWTHGPTLRARRVLLGTNAFPSPLRRIRPYVVPVWDHVLVTEPLDDAQRAAIGWSGQEGLADSGNQFHYYRLTGDRRILWGGYDALYYYGSDLSARRARNPATEERLATHFLTTFPQLAGIRFTHRWAGAIDTCTRFTAFWHRGMSGKVVGVQGYTGLGVGASRFGAQVALDLLFERQTERVGLSMVRQRPVPFPPEPARWAGIQLTRRSIARADASDGRRDVWLRTLDRLGLGFHS